MVKDLKTWIMEILDVAPELDPYNVSLAMHKKYSADEVAQAMYELEGAGKLPKKHWESKKFEVIEVETIEPEIILSDKPLEEVKTNAEKQKKKRKE